MYVPGGAVGMRVELLAMTGPGAERGSASTSFLRMAVAGRQTFMRLCGDDRMLTTVAMKLSSRLDHP